MASCIALPQLTGCAAPARDDVDFTGALRTGGARSLHRWLHFSLAPTAERQRTAIVPRAPPQDWRAAMRGKHILVVEDNFLISDELVEMLRREEAVVEGPIGEHLPLSTS